MKKLVSADDQEKIELIPALSSEEREKQMIQLAVDLAEKKLRDGTASPQIISHYLKLASSKERLEKEKLEKENELLRAKTEALQAQKDLKDIYQNALDAMKNYGYLGNQEIDEDEEDEYFN